MYSMLIMFILVIVAGWLDSRLDWEEDKFEHNKSAFHNRFRDHAVRIMKTYGFHILAMWESKTETRTEFVYLLEWADESTLRAAWERFRTDEEWKEIKRITAAQHGDLVGEIEDCVLAAVSYSPSYS